LAKLLTKSKFACLELFQENMVKAMKNNNTQDWRVNDKYEEKNPKISPSDTNSELSMQDLRCSSRKHSLHLGWYS
jgi:hypothetical protein